MMHLKPALRNRRARVPTSRPKKGCHHWKTITSGEKAWTCLNARSHVDGFNGVRVGSAWASNFKWLVSIWLVPGKSILGYSLRNETTWTVWPRLFSSLQSQYTWWAMPPRSGYAGPNILTL